MAKNYKTTLYLFWAVGGSENPGYWENSCHI